MKKKDIILISIIVILIIVIIGLLLFYRNNKDSKNLTYKTIEAEVLAVGEDYLLVTTDDEIDYVINTNDTEYEVGEKLKLELTEVDEIKIPIEATATKITKVGESSVQVEDNQEDKVLPPQDSVDNTISNDSAINNTNGEQEIENNYTEEDVIQYFSTLETELTNYNNDVSIGKKIKEKFVKCIDFIFYGGTIGGKTFDELSNTAKLKIIKLALSIDSKIDSVFPGYKESISNTYQNIKNKLVEKYLDITTTICTNEKELCENAKEGFKDLKSSFGITWDFIKNLAGTTTTKLKNWYEIWRYN